jgi:hypothetical protein
MATLMGDNDYLQFAETSKTKNEDGTTTRTFTVANLSPYPDGTMTDIEVQPQFSGVSSSKYQSHEASKGTYNQTTNTWDIGTLKPGETATVTIDTKDCDEEGNGDDGTGGGGDDGGYDDGYDGPPQPCTTDTPRGSRIISNPTGQKRIITNNPDGTIRTSNQNLAPEIGDKVLLQNTGCGYITTGTTTKESKFTSQSKSGLNQGKTECNINPGDRVPYDDNGNGNNGTVEPDGDECLRTYAVQQVRSPRQYTQGINGGFYYKVSFGNPGCDFEGGDAGGIWLYPGMEPEFLLDVHIAREPGPEDQRDAKPTCWSSDVNGGLMSGACGASGLCERCEDAYGNFTGMDCDCEHPQSYCCIKPCQYWQWYDCNIWSNQQLGADHCSDKMQWWYPYGALWIYCHEHGVDTNSGGACGEMTYPTGYVMVENLTSGWSMINGPTFVFSPNSDDFDPFYDPKKGGGIGGSGFNMDECKAKYQNQGLTNEEIDFICQEKVKPDFTGWSECMVRLYNRNPNLTYDEIVQLCDENPGKTTCEINMKQQYPEMSDEEITEACTEDRDSYTIRFRPMNQTGRPFLLESMVFFVGGCSGCMWGRPGISMYWSEPSTTIGPLRVCPTSTEDAEGFSGISDREEDLAEDIGIK